MALINCPNCGKEISDKALKCPSCDFDMVQKEVLTCKECGQEISEGMQSCPNCGCPITQHEEKTEDVSEKKPNKKKIVTIAIIAIVVILGAILIKGASAEQNFVDLYNTMVDGGRQAEEANMLIQSVWNNSIYSVSDKKTDKYTKNSSGYFYSDFDDALKKLYDSKSFRNKQKGVYEKQQEAAKLMNKLANHPAKYDERYADFKSCYKTFVKFSNMTLNPVGSLNSYTEDYNKLDKALSNKLSELYLYFEE